MIGLVAAALLFTATPAGSPATLTVAGPRGEVRLPVRSDAAGVPLVSAGGLASALAGSLELEDGWAEMSIASQSFRFLLGAPLYVMGDSAAPLAAAARMLRDTVFIPFQFASEILPHVAASYFRYDPDTARLTETGPIKVTRVAAKPEPKRLPNGLLPGHLVTIDAGHGGVDPGNPGMFFPRGVREKDVTLQISLMLRQELRKRGVAVRMTRTTDTLIALGDRGKYCAEGCDLFVSIHINSLPKRRGYQSVRGFETYFLAEAKTEDAARVARMENDAIRYEPPTQQSASLSGLDFILKDLQTNEHLRESAHAAELIQESLAQVHDGTNRGVKQAGFMVLTTASRPAVLAELGYSTNPQDGKLLTDPVRQRRLASALADAIVSYLLDYERKTGQSSELSRGAR